MRIGLHELLADAADRGAAVGAFTAYNVETADAILHAAESRSCGVILLVSSQTLRSTVGDTLVAALCGVVTRSPVPCCLQLDHEQHLDAMEAALERGFGAVMADGSKLPNDENAAFVRAAVRLAQQYGADVEAELGHVAGDEDIATAATRGALTDPEEAQEYVRETGVACLAVSIGNVHGRYREPPRLDWQRLHALRAAISAPLTLHGASGIPDADIRTAVRAGISKINVNTELRDRYFDVLLTQSHALREGAQLLRLTEDLSQHLREVVERKLELFGN